MTEGQEHDGVESLERARVGASELSWAMRDLNRAAAEVDGTLADRLGLRRTDYTAMGHLLESAAPLGPVEIARRLGISSGSATELIDRLERAGHVERRRETGDRRRVGVHASERTTRRLLTELSPLFIEIDSLAERFTPEEQDVITRFLRSAAGSMREWQQAGGPSDNR